MSSGKARLVIDACVAQSAGDDNATAEDACNCHDILLEVYMHRHELVVTDFIIDEWNRHHSNWCWRWRSDMYQADLVHYVRNCANAALWLKVVQDMKDPCEVAERKKDFGYVEAALVTDRTVISSDRRFKNAYSVIARKVTELSEIVCVNPCEPADTPLDWVRNGAPRDDWRKL